jgi:hypothetical protein
VTVVRRAIFEWAEAAKKVAFFDTEKGDLSETFGARQYGKQA